MSNEKASEYHPVKFLDKLEGNNHIVLLYDDEKYGNLIIARYFQKGLEKGQSCIYFTDEEPEAVESRLRAQSIDVDKYKQSNSLRIIKTQPASGDSLNPLDLLKTFRAASTQGMKGPFRFAGRTIMDIESKPGMMQGMEVERMGQKHFPEFDNAQMCFYDVHKLEPTMRNEWIAGLVRNHHYVIYASTPDKAVAFETDLLEED
jgi:hypothetical protein